MRDSMVFYRSFAEALEQLPADLYKEAMQAILNYALNDIEPECSGVANALFIMAKPQIDTNNKRYENSKKGGRPKTKNQNADSGNQTETKVKPNNNQAETKQKPKSEKAKPNVYVNVNDNVNVDSKESNNTCVGYTDAFESLWKVYPRKKEKASAYKAYKARLKDYKHEQLLLATQRYAEECKILDTEERYIKHGSTFFGPSLPFADYLDSGYKKPVARSGTQKQNSFNNFEQRTYDFDALQRALQYKH